MKKVINYLLIVPVLIFSFLLFFLQTALADGIILEKYPLDRWDFLSETSQQAFINYEDGLEKMIIGVGLEKSDVAAVWIFPIPAEPEKTSIDVVRNFPDFKGEDIFEKAKINLKDIGNSLRETQVYYPLVHALIMPSKSLNPWGLDLGLNNPFGSLSAETEPDVIIHEQLDKAGLTTQIITAKTAVGLYDYLKEKGLAIESGAIPVLNYYIGKEFSFVVSWINPKEPEIDISLAEIKKDVRSNFFGRNQFGNQYPKYQKLVSEIKEKYFSGVFDYIKKNNLELISSQNEAFEELANGIFDNKEILIELYPSKKTKQSGHRGVLVTFPTAKIYFPLLPTSVYESQTIPVTIRVLGYVSPEIPSKIKSYTNTAYYFAKNPLFNEELKNFYEPSDYIKYTKIKINAPSRYFTDDLWIGRQTPIKTHFAFLASENPVVIFLILLVLISFTTGALIGPLIFKTKFLNAGKYGLLALANCFSLLGLTAVMILINPKSGKNFSKEKKLWFVFLFSISFLFFSWLVIKLITSCL
ncbi:MAG: hypothetical protein JW991_01765 [Candidatus Pacebacteria bacterium]|nr:hypothetical protein [Candidatus Paceibacterota bacterium]